MKKKTPIVVAALCAAVLLLGGCSAVEGVKQATRQDPVVTDSAFLYDEETGVYKTVAVIRNDTPYSFSLGFVLPEALDADGNKMEQQKDNEGLEPGQVDIGYALLYYWLCPGETTAVMDTNENLVAAGLDSELSTYFDTVPASLEWTAKPDYATRDPQLEPHGISVVSCEAGEDPYAEFNEDEYGRYEVTLRNDSENTYVFNPGECRYYAGDKPFSFDVIAVYRDAEGAIRDAEKLYLVFEDTEPDLAPGSENKLIFESDHVVDDDSLTPEYYISPFDF